MFLVVCYSADWQSRGYFASQSYALTGGIAAGDLSIDDRG